MAYHPQPIPMPLPLPLNCQMVNVMTPHGMAQMAVNMQPAFVAHSHPIGIGMVRPCEILAHLSFGFLFDLFFSLSRQLFVSPFFRLPFPRYLMSGSVHVF